MKKLITVLLLVLTLVTTTFALNTEENTSLDIRTRLNNAERNIIDNQTNVYIDETGNVSDESTAVKAQLTFDWSLTQDEVVTIQKGDTFTFKLDGDYSIPDTKSVALDAYATLSVSTDKAVTLTFDDIEGLTTEISGRFEILVDLVKEAVQEVPEVAPVVPETPVTPDAPVAPLASEPKDIRDRLNKPNLNIITGGEVKFDKPDDPININSTLNIKFDWRLPEPSEGLIEAGDYFTFNIPDEIKIPVEYNGSLVSDGVEYGTYNITKEGLVTLTFNEKAVGESNVKGSVKLAGGLNETVLTGPGQIVVEFPFEDKTKLEFDLRPLGDHKSISKKVHRNYNENNKDSGKANSTHIEWDVVINTGYERLNKPVITDTFDDKLEFVGAKVFYASTDLQGNLIGGYDANPADSSEYTIDPVTGQVSFTKEINRPYVIRYNTKIKESAMPGPEGGTLKFGNKATITTDGKSLDASASLNINYNALLKKGLAKYNPKDQSFDWKIEYNYRENKIQNPTLVDTFDKDLEYVDGSTKIYKKGTTVEISSDLYTVSNVDNVLTIKFKNEITEAYDIKYTTRVKDGIIISGDKVFENKVVSDGVTSGGTGTAKQQAIVKSSPAINYIDKTIDWKITINQNKYLMENIVVTDTYRNEGLTLKQNTVVVKDGVTVIDPTNYTVTPTLKDGVGKEIGFVLKFKDTYKTTSTLDITFKTDYDINGLKPGTTGNHFINDASVDWVTDGKSYNSKSWAERWVNDHARDNGQKSGFYNALTKEITWTVDVNYNSEDLKNAKISDVVQKGQHYVDGSVTLHEFTVKANGEIVVGDSVALDTNNLQLPTVENGHEIVVKLPDGNKKYRLVFKTSLEGEVINATYKNTAVFTGGLKDRTLDASVSINHGGRTAGKGGKQVENKINWTVNINSSQSTIHNPVLTDTPTDNLIIIEDSFKVHGVTWAYANNKWDFTVNPADELVQGVDYEVVVTTTNEETNQQQFVLKFKGDLEKVISKTYVLTYDTLINATKDNLKVGNTAVLEGNGQKFEDTDGTTGFEVVIWDSEGTGSGEHASFSLLKLDNTTKKPLEGVVFELYNSKNVLVARRTTGADGTAKFMKLYYDTYTLKEVETVSGFIISDELFKGVEVKVVKDMNHEKDILTFTNERNTLTILKQDSNGTTLKGSEFRLELLNVETDLFEVIQENIAVTEGSIVLDSPVVGHYRLTETKANTGSVLNLTPIKFDIVKNDNGQAVNYIATFVNYRGSFTLRKLAYDNTPLAGVEFTYTNEKGVEATALTNNEGVLLVQDLAPGKYTVRETASAEGHIISSKIHEVTILAEEAGEPVVIDLGEVKNVKASVSFLKTDVAGNALKGAKFKLFQIGEGGRTEITGDFTSNELGIVSAENLEPGDYVFVEETAPNGFVLNTKELHFTINDTYTYDTNGKVHIELEENFVNYKGSVELSKTNHKDGALQGATFELFNAEDVKIGTYTTSKEGLIKVTDLAVGDYYFVETESADGHIVNTNKIPFTIKDASEGLPETVTVSAKNIKASIQFVKYGSNEEALAGAVFNLYAKDDLETVIATATSSEVGLVRFENVSVGEYVILEVSSADGHIINTTPIEVTVHPETDELVVEYSLENFINYKGSVELSKTDYKDEALEGATFELYNSKDELIETFKTDENGLIHVSDLSVGEYYFLETESADGNIVNTNKIHFEIKDAFEGTPEVIEVSSKNIRASVSFKKTDVLGKPLQGAKFELYNELNELVATAESSVEGVVNVENLSPGKYYFKEVVAAKGYVLNTARIEFEIEGATADEKVHIELADFINYQGSLVVNKVDKNGKLLKEATFELVSEELNYKATLSTEGGVLKVDGLAPGIYTLTEVSAPNGYQLDKTARTFEIVKEHLGELKVVEIDVVNKEIVKLPATGVGANRMLETGMILSALGFIMIKMKLKREEQN